MRIDDIEIIVQNKILNYYDKMLVELLIIMAEECRRPEPSRYIAIFDCSYRSRLLPPRAQ